MSLGLAIARSTLGAFLLIAAASKLLDYSDARATLATHLGFKRARRLTPILIAFELGVGALLFVDPVEAAAAVGAGILFLGFTAFSVLLARSGDRTLSCGCFGLAIPSRSGAFSIGRNALLALAAFGLAASPTRHLEPIAVVNALFAGVAFSVLLLGLGALDAIRAARRIYLPTLEGRLNDA
jgi:hypothetical protein